MLSNKIVEKNRQNVETKKCAYEFEQSAVVPVGMLVGEDGVGARIVVAEAGVEDADGGRGKVGLVLLDLRLEIVLLTVGQHVLVDERAGERYGERIVGAAPEHFGELVAVEDDREYDEKVERLLLGLARVRHVEAQLVHVDLEYVDHVVDGGQLLEHLVQSVGQKVLGQLVLHET